MNYLKYIWLRMYRKKADMQGKKSFEKMALLYAEASKGWIAQASGEGWSR